MHNTRSALLIVTLLLGVFLLTSLSAIPAFSADWDVMIQVHEVQSLTDDDADGPDDMYWVVDLNATNGRGTPVHCDAKDDHEDDNNHITPRDWKCRFKINGGPDAMVQIKLQLFEHDTTSADDKFDINPVDGKKFLLMFFQPQTSQIRIEGVPGQDVMHCAYGRMKTEGNEGDDKAQIVFSVSASDVGEPDGDSDGDGLLDSWEVCGIDGDKNDVPEVNLAGMGANRYRKDVFVEVDWMLQPNVPGVPGHSHEPWLPSMINAWNEFNLASVTSPTPTGGSNPGIALHIDTGALYANYQLDYNGDGIPEIVVPATGNWDVNGDGMPDIGDLRTLSGTPGGGNLVPEDSQLSGVGTAPNIDYFATGSDFAAIKAANFNSVRENVFHYALFGHLLAGAGNTSGIADSCGKVACNDFMVTLGGFIPTSSSPIPRQTVDANGDGRPDVAPPGAPPAAIITGPSGLPVDGQFSHHTGTFMHELGHNLGLGHGGGDTVNYKPNYLSIMSYSWQIRGIGFDFNNDRLADQVGLSLDGDTVNDAQRFLYSGSALTLLNEGAGSPPFLNETVGVDANPNPAMKSFSCPASGMANPVVVQGRADRAENWNCNTNTSEISISADVNNHSRSSGMLETLNGFNDYNRLNNGGLDFNRGISAEEQIALDSTTVRIVDPGQEFRNRCEDRQRVKFEDFAVGTVVTGQYGPTATFLSDDLRRPEIVDRAGRNNVPTQSPDQSLMNRSRTGKGVPMVIEFSPAQRAVSLFYGQAGLTDDSQHERARAVLKAFDENGLPMGEIVQPFPLPGAGVTNPITAVPVWPDQAIKRIEFRYETDFAADNEVLREPVQIDDLVVCGKVKEVHVAVVPNPPKFGSQLAHLRVVSENIRAVAAMDGGPDHVAYVHEPFTGLTVNIDGGVSTTDLTVIRPEGSKLTIDAPSTFGGSKFRYWKHSSGTKFGNKNSTVELTLLRDGVLTAVYEGRERPGEPPQRPNNVDGTH